MTNTKNALHFSFKITLANCLSFELGSREVVIIIFGSSTPIHLYSSSALLFTPSPPASSNSKDCCRSRASFWSSVGMVLLAAIRFTKNYCIGWQFINRYVDYRIMFLCKKLTVQGRLQPWFLVLNCSPLAFYSLSINILPSLPCLSTKLKFMRLAIFHCSKTSRRCISKSTNWTWKLRFCLWYLFFAYWKFHNGPTRPDLRAILQTRDNLRTTSKKMMCKTIYSQDLILKRDESLYNWNYFTIAIYYNSLSVGCL